MSMTARKPATTPGVKHESTAWSPRRIALLLLRRARILAAPHFAVHLHAM